MGSLSDMEKIIYHENEDVKKIFTVLDASKIQSGFDLSSKYRDLSVSICFGTVKRWLCVYEGEKGRAGFQLRPPIPPVDVLFLVFGDDVFHQMDLKFL